jgi:hypothetical protein
VTTTESVVTPERYEQGVSYADWRAAIDRNETRFDENYEGFIPTAEEVAKVKDLVARGATKCLALGEAWCPDVFRGLPVIARIAEQTGMDLKVFFRDQNLDIMNEFLKRGEFQSIPTLVFYDKNHRYLGHWIERAAKADAEMPQMAAIRAPLNNPDISEADRARIMAEYAAFQTGPVWKGWQHAQVAEIIELIEKAL